MSSLQPTSAEASLHLKPLHRSSVCSVVSRHSHALKSLHPPRTPSRAMTLALTSSFIFGK